MRGISETREELSVHCFSTLTFGDRQASRARHLPFGPSWPVRVATLANARVSLAGKDIKAAAQWHAEMMGRPVDVTPMSELAE